SESISAFSDATSPLALSYLRSASVYLNSAFFSFDSLSALLTALYWARASSTARRASTSSCCSGDGRERSASICRCLAVTCCESVEASRSSVLIWLRISPVCATAPKCQPVATTRKQAACMYLHFIGISNPQVRFCPFPAGSWVRRSRRNMADKHRSVKMGPDFTSLVEHGPAGWLTRVAGLH